MPRNLTTAQKIAHAFGTFHGGINGTTAPDGLVGKTTTGKWFHHNNTAVTTLGGYLRDDMMMKMPEDAPGYDIELGAGGMHFKEDDVTELEAYKKAVKVANMMINAGWFEIVKNSPDFFELLINKLLPEYE